MYMYNHNSSLITCNKSKSVHSGYPLTRKYVSTLEHIFHKHIVSIHTYTHLHVCSVSLTITRQNATIPWNLKGAIQSPFSHHSVDWMAGTFQWPFSDIQSPFRRLSLIFTFLFFSYITDLVCIIYSYIWC